MEEYEGRGELRGRQARGEIGKNVLVFGGHRQSPRCTGRLLKSPKTPAPREGKAWRATATPVKEEDHKAMRRAMVKKWNPESKTEAQAFHGLRTRFGGCEETTAEGAVVVWTDGSAVRHSNGADNGVKCQQQTHWQDTLRLQESRPHHWGR